MKRPHWLAIVALLLCGPALAQQSESTQKDNAEAEQAYQRANQAQRETGLAQRRAAREAEMARMSRDAERMKALRQGLAAPSAPRTTTGAPDFTGIGIGKGAPQ